MRIRKTQEGAGNRGTGPIPPSNDDSLNFWGFFLYVCIILSFYQLSRSLSLSTFQGFASLIDTGSSAGQINLHHIHQTKERRNVDAMLTWNLDPCANSSGGTLCDSASWVHMLSRASCVQETALVHLAVKLACCSSSPVCFPV